MISISLLFDIKNQNFEETRIVSFLIYVVFTRPRFFTVINNKIFQETFARCNQPSIHLLKPSSFYIVNNSPSTSTGFFRRSIDNQPVNFNSEISLESRHVYNLRIINLNIKAQWHLLDILPTNG